MFKSRRAVLVAILACILAVPAALAQISSGQECKSIDPIAAIINGRRVITQKEVDEYVAQQINDLQEKIYVIRRNALNNLITKAILEEEAKSRGLSISDLKNVLIPGKVDIDQKQVDQLYLANISGFAELGEDEVKERIKLDLESQEKIDKYKAALGQIRSRLNTEIRLLPPNIVRSKVIAMGPSRGGEDALVTVVEFSDFQCPFCRQAAKTLDNIAKHYGDRIRIVYKHFPLSIHPQAFQAAQASVCADSQGKFWQYHDSLFNSDGDMSLAYLLKIGASIGLDQEEFSHCLSSVAAKEVVMRDSQEAQKLSIQGTPTFLLNGKLIKGALNEDEFKKAIDNELEIMGKLKK